MTTTFDDAAASTEQSSKGTARPTRSRAWRRRLIAGTIPVLIVGLATAAEYSKWLSDNAADLTAARVQSVVAATEGVEAMLSYKPDTVQQDVDAAKVRLTGTLRVSYTSLADDVVAPSAIQKLITSVATVPAAAAVSASESRATVLVFVNQSITVGTRAPTTTASTVRVGLDKVFDRWLVSSFDPI